MSRFPVRSLDKLSLEGLQSEIGQLIRRWWHCGLSTGPLDGQAWAPPVEVREELDAYRVTIELPGVNRTTLELTTEAGGLVVSGEKPPPTMPVPAEDEAAPTEETATTRVLQTERRYGGFRRTISLPGSVRTEAASAVLDNGVLDVTLPKAAGSGPEGVRIEIRTPHE